VGRLAGAARDGLLWAVAAGLAIFTGYHILAQYQGAGAPPPNSAKLKRVLMGLTAGIETDAAAHAGVFAPPEGLEARLRAEQQWPDTLDNPWGGPVVVLPLASPLPKDGQLGPGKPPVAGTPPDARTYGTVLYGLDDGGYTLVGVGQQGDQAVVVRFP